MFSLANKVCLVTGASRGIGASIAKHMAMAGADVVVNYNQSKEQAMEVVKEIQKMGRKAVPVQGDVRKEEDVKRLFQTTLDQFEKLDIFANNSGINGPDDIFGVDLKKWDEFILTNLTSTFVGLKCAAEIMRKQKYGRIIINSSTTGQRGAHYGQVHYAASKGGQLAMMRSLARTLGPYGITVNAVAAGVIVTEMLGKTHNSSAKQDELINATPLRVFGRPEDVATAFVFFASDEAHWITGATLDINGGFYMR